MAKLTALIILFTWKFSEAVRCERRPFRSTHPPSDSGGKFLLEIDLGAESENKYLPQQQYVVYIESNKKDNLISANRNDLCMLLKLRATDPTSHAFTAFMVWPEGHTETDFQNPRATLIKNPGFMRLDEKNRTKFSERCHNTVEMINAAPLSEVEMFWESPDKGNNCVTLHAMVAENEELWYQDLLYVVCEDDSFLGDVSGSINKNCEICDEAKYELTFEGKWSRNTHPQKFPVNDWTVYYGDLIGASHSSEFTMWKDGSTASDAMTHLALSNDTDPIEQEILNSYIDGHIRTLIKGKGHGPMHGSLNDPTYALVRVDKVHHLISTATALRPSPDWFLGISNFELCQQNNTWLQYKSLDLIPWDAGKSKGISFESLQGPFVTEPIGRVRVGSFDRESPFYNMNYKQVKPFATLSIRLIRTFPKDCEEIVESNEPRKDAEEKEAEPEPPSRRTSPPPDEDPDDNSSGVKPETGPGDADVCPLGEWSAWTECSSLCGTGFRSRNRYHLVNGVEYRYYKPEERKPSNIQAPSSECVEMRVGDKLETEECQETKGCRSPEALIALPLQPEDSVSRHSRTAEDREVQDCVMSSWSRWSACSVSCGEGSQMRTRNVIKYPKNGGRRCPRRHEDMKKCIMDPCHMFD